VVKPEGLVCTIKRYWVFQFHVMLETWFIVNERLVPEPEGGTLPVPVQPVQMYLVPEEPDHREVTEPIIVAPESNHPLVGIGEPYGEVTVR
jgi:hypothetical protein